MTRWRVPYPKFGSAPNLPRVAAIAATLGIDLAAFGERGAVIVGTNGKGSTAAMTAALLQRSGRGVGLFTSPHLFVLNERLRFDGCDIADDELDRHWHRVRAAADTYVEGRNERFGAFEFLFLIAADWFAARGAHYTVWEAGIGGRFDPVRLIEARRLALTSLDLEHTEFLGDTLEHIARDKLDATPRGGRAFVATSCAQQRDAIEEHNRARGVDTVWVDDKLSFGLEPPLPGAHQRGNAALALALADDVVALSEVQKREGLAATRWPGRLEVLQAEPLFVIDVGHTPEAARAARHGFEDLRGARSATLVCGVSKDKKAREIVGALASGFGRIVCTQARHKGLAPETVAGLAREANPRAEVVVAVSAEAARALALRGTESEAILVAGGLFLAAEFRALHLGLDPEQLIQL